VKASNSEGVWNENGTSLKSSYFRMVANWLFQSSAAVSLLALIFFAISIISGTKAETARGAILKESVQ
jgi:hypothetical protein